MAKQASNKKQEPRQLSNTEIIDILLTKDLGEYQNLLDLFAMSRTILNEDKAYSKELTLIVKKKATELLREGRTEFYKIYNYCLLFLAQSHGSFEDYLLYTERKRDVEKAFYYPRMKQIRWLVQELQKFLDDEYDLLTISMPPGTSKAGIMTSKVLTPKGWVMMKDIKVGDKVISGTGNISTVTGVFPQGKKPCYDVILDDGSKTTVSKDHLWTVQTRDDRNKERFGENGRYRTVELSSMLKNIRVENGKRLNYSIDYVPKIEFEEKDLLIDPYLLGILIGDGCFSDGIGSNIGITLPDDEIRVRIDSLVNGELHNKDKYNWYIVGEANREIRDALTVYGLYGHKSYEKFIPRDYLHASYDNRLELLRGLLDSDGCAYGNGICYTTSSPQLAEDVKELVHSLGGYASLNIRTNTGYKDKDGNFIKCRDSYGLCIQFSSKQPNPFYLTRKRENYKPKREVLKRFIKEVNYVGDMDCQCIYIDDPSHLYITDDYIITHNTTLAAFFLSYYIGLYPDKPNLMSSHSGVMTTMFYESVLDIITSKEYCWGEVFPNVPLESTNAKNSELNMGKFKPFKSLTCRPIRGSLTGVTRCEGILYVDDIISGQEEALSKPRLDKLWNEYATDLRSRKKTGCKELHIATRWSVHDVIGRLERQYEGNPRTKFIAVPDIDPQSGESNFNYNYGVGFDTQFFKDIALTMDEVSYRCLYKNQPIEREGLLYREDELRRYLNMPEDEPDAIIAVCDTKDTGNDNNSLVVAYVYNNDLYIADVVFSNIDPLTLDELNAEMLLKHKVQQAQFESNREGSRTANEVEKIVKARGGRCHITKKFTSQNKETKIIVNSSFVKQHFIFKDASLYDPRSDYGKFMAEMLGYVQIGKNAHDDSVDSLAMLALFYENMVGNKVEIMSRSELGF